jgi:hypothetical protein
LAARKRRARYSNSAMQIRFHKLDQRKHRLEVVRVDGRRESVECETRSTLLHDFLHYAIECEAGLEQGFWGTLERSTLASLMQSTQAPLETEGGLGAIERFVGALHGATQGVPRAELLEGVRRVYAMLGESPPVPLSEAFMAAVEERLRRLRGRWRATPFGSALELEWPTP